MATAPIIIGMMTSNVIATQMLFCNAVQVDLAAVLQPVVHVAVTNAWIIMMPTIIMTINVTRIPTMPAPILANV
jgi:hypothetical protein